MINQPRRAAPATSASLACFGGFGALVLRRCFVGPLEAASKAADPPQSAIAAIMYGGAVWLPVFLRMRGRAIRRAPLCISLARPKNLYNAAGGARGVVLRVLRHDHHHTHSSPSTYKARTRTSDERHATRSELERHALLPIDQECRSCHPSTLAIRTRRPGRRCEGAAVEGSRGPVPGPTSARRPRRAASTGNACGNHAVRQTLGLWPFRVEDSSQYG
jgi:hypothetical protein